MTALKHDLARQASMNSARRSRYETILSIAGFDDHAEASRITRQGVAAESPSLKAIRDVGAGVAGPLLYSYVRWVATDAYARGIRRLFFVARDGEALYTVANACPDIRDAFELRMLYGSRQSWYLAGLNVLEPQSESWLTEHADKLTAEQFLERLGLTVGLVGGLAHQPQRLGTAGVQRMLEHIGRSEVRVAIAGQVEARRRIIRQYLSQEEVSRDHPCALVDLGWTGRMYAALNAVFRDRSVQMPPIYFFGLFRAVPIEFECHAWLFDTCALPDVPVRRVGAALETFCISDSGHTVGYESDSDRRVKPINNTGSSDRALTWGLPTLRRAIASFAAESRAAKPLDRNTAISLLQEFWYRPEPDEATSWGDAPYEDDQQAVLETRLAAPTGLLHAVRHIRGRTVPWTAQCWPDGARARTTGPARAILDLAMRTGWIRLH